VGKLAIPCLVDLNFLSPEWTKLLSFILLTSNLSVRYLLGDTFMHATDVSDFYTEQNLNEQIIDVYIQYILNVYLEHFLNVYTDFILNVYI